MKKPRVTGADVISRFHREREILSALSHPNILPLLGVCATPPDYCFALELCPRGSLEDVLHVEGVRLAWEEVREIGGQLARAVDFLHQKGILHRDLKSSNVLVRRAPARVGGESEGEGAGEGGWEVVLADFDTAEYEHVSQEQERESGKTRKNRTVGSLVTMAPEILRNTGVGTGKGFFVFTQGSDVYAMGVTLNELCTATMPYSDRFTSDINLHTVLNINYSKHTLAAAIIRESLR